MSEQEKGEVLPFRSRHESERKESDIPERFAAFERSIRKPNLREVKLFNEKEFLGKYLDLIAKIYNLRQGLDQSQTKTSEEYESVLDQFEKLIEEVPEDYKYLKPEDATKRKEEIDKQE